MGRKLPSSVARAPVVQKCILPLNAYVHTNTWEIQFFRYCIAKTRKPLGTENPTENGLTVTSQRDRDACDATGHVRFWFSMSWKNEREWQMNVNIHLSGWLFQNEVYNSIMCKETTYSVLLRVLSHSSPYLRGFFGKIVQLLIQSASYGDINDYYLK
jgi:hypothetical protein